jgi:hypothetical protein
LAIVSQNACKKLNKFISSVDDHGDSKDGIEEEEERHITMRQRLG